MITLTFKCVDKHETLVGNRVNATVTLQSLDAPASPSGIPYGMGAVVGVPNAPNPNAPQPVLSSTQGGEQPVEPAFQAVADGLRLSLSGTPDEIAKFSIGKILVFTLQDDSAVKKSQKT